MKINRFAFIGAASGTLIFNGLIYFSPPAWSLSPDILFRLVILSLPLFLFFYFVVFEANRKPPDKFTLRYDHNPVPAFNRADKLDLWLQTRMGAITRKVLLIVIGAGVAWYAIEKQGWLIH